MTDAFPQPLRAVILHGAGYAGGELIRLVLAHPLLDLAAVTSRHFVGQPLHAAHAVLRGQTDAAFADPADLASIDFDVAFVTAEHGQGEAAVTALRASGFAGPIVDLSADHRLADAALYPEWYGREHGALDQLAEAVYGLAEVNAPYAEGTRLVANPGCFATGLALALYPLAQHLDELDAHVTALTGASGSGARPKPTTHFPTRDGNVRAYKVLGHQHLAEVQQVLGDARVRFVPTSGPWTRGIWGTAHVALPDGMSQDDVDGWFAEAYGDRPLVRLSPGGLPELLPCVGTPFCDLGWIVKDGHLVVGFALDNLLKGAASQAVQNLNLLLGWPEALGLLPGVAIPVAA
jgi:N-acetyl-gamma-glutamyl-phosphate reductase